MASFRQHGNGWQARVRRKGTPDQTKSFFSLTAYGFRAWP